MIDIFAKHQLHNQRPAKKYTANQVRRRQKAVKLGYILHPDKSDEGGHRYALYYDESTMRDEKFERASWRAGFHIFKWIER
jgi:hypothetical protein